MSRCKTLNRRVIAERHSLSSRGEMAFVDSTSCRAEGPGPPTRRRHPAQVISARVGAKNSVQNEFAEADDRAGKPE
jgi:hypothetical protein